MTTPRIYLACLAAYNNGKLHGCWVDATDHDEITEALEKMLQASPEPDAEEWAIHDQEGFDGFSLGENEDLETVAQIGALIEEHGPAFAAWYSYTGSVSGDVEDAFNDAYCGEYDHERAYAEYCVDEGFFGDIPSHLECYIDYDAIARDLFCGDYYSADNPAGGIFVFRSI